MKKWTIGRVNIWHLNVSCLWFFDGGIISKYFANGSTGYTNRRTVNAVSITDVNISQTEIIIVV